MKLPLQLPAQRQLPLPLPLPLRLRLQLQLQLQLLLTLGSPCYGATSPVPKSGSVRNSLRSDNGRFFIRFRHWRRVALDGDPQVKSNCNGNGSFKSERNCNCNCRCAGLWQVSLKLLRESSIGKTCRWQMAS